MKKDVRRFPGSHSPQFDMALNFFKGQPSLPEVPDGRAGQEQVSIVAVSQSSHVRVNEDRDIVHLEVFLQEMALFFLYDYIYCLIVRIPLKWQPS